MPSVDVVKRALRSLAVRTDTARPPYLTILEEAPRAARDIERAVGFIDAVGLDGLEEAIRDARADGYRSRAEDAQAVLDRIREYRAVARGNQDTGTSQDGDSVSMESSTDDHFHRARGTHKRRAGQRSNE